MSSRRGDPRLSRDYKKARLSVLARDEWTCRYCQDTATTVDHVIPIAKGGDPISPDNLVAACRRCNSSKGSRSEGLFLQRQRTPPVFSEHPSTMVTDQSKDSPFKIRPNPSQ
jgi:5-methylcytosine-specific restriction endonuclease McrA